MIAREPRPKRPRPGWLYHDDAVAVVDKPPKVASTPIDGFDDNLLDLWPKDWPEPVATVADLDPEASGVMVFALTEHAATVMGKYLRPPRGERVYTAIVSGYVPEDMTIDIPIRKDKSGRRVRISRGPGNKACTRVELVERLAGNSVLECTPDVDFPGQVRAHLQAVGFPLAVDGKYGGGSCLLLSMLKSDYRPNKRRPEIPLIDRLSLHALRVSFAHPASGDRLTFEAPQPKDFRATIQQLSRLA
jgi:23S rRNA-/tRNA-specific pseudouridylate synthase